MCTRDARASSPKKCAALKRAPNRTVYRLLRFVIRVFLCFLDRLLGRRPDGEVGGRKICGWRSLFTKRKANGHCGHDRYSSFFTATAFEFLLNICFSFGSQHKTGDLSLACSFGCCDTIGKERESYSAGFCIKVEKFHSLVLRLFKKYS